MTQGEIVRVVLTADEGKVITNGVVYGKVVYPAQGMDLSTFYEISEEEYEEILKREEAEAEIVND